MLIDRAGYRSGDLSRVRKQAAAVRSTSTARLLMHIRNDPHIKGWAGLEFVNGSLKRCKDLVRLHANKQAAIGDAYMYPVFFPLLKPKGPCYDAREDGDMFGLIRHLLDRY